MPEYIFKSKVDLALDRFGQIDVLINNAGISQRSLIKDTVYSVDSRLININFLGTITLSKAVLPVKREKRIVLTYLKDFDYFSILWNVKQYAATPLRSTYAASKRALHGFFDSIRLEHYDDHIDVTTVCPSSVKTDISRNAFSESGVLHKQMDTKTETGTDPTICANDILRGVAARKYECYIGRSASGLIYLQRFCPQLLFHFLRRVKTS